MTTTSKRLTLPGPIMLAGAGKMGGALLAGWLEQGLDPKLVLVQDPSPPPEVTKLIVDNGIVCAPTIALGDKPLSVLLVAVKPQLMDIVLPSVAPLVSAGTVVLSIAAGRTLSGFAAHLPAGAAIVRSMPNTPASIGRGITVACANAHVTQAQRAICQALLEAVGSFAWVEDESQLDAVTAVSGSGPAYIFLLAEVMAKAGEAVGLPKELSARLARETVSGAGALLAASDLDAAKLRENVTSPGGTTAAALSVLMAEPGLEDLMRRAIEAATIRGRELAK
jgi:pyrroline-5-carboxylate reductase